jgi:Tfp pilus assembly protein PilX
MNTLNEIPKDQLDHFKVNVKEWLDIDEKIKNLETEERDMKKLRNKQLEPKITGFMRSYNISDLNTESGKLRCNERNTKTPVNKKTIQESLQKILSTEQTETAMNEIYLNRQVITKYTLSRPKK